MVLYTSYWIISEGLTMYHFIVMMSLSIIPHHIASYLISAKYIVMVVYRQPIIGLMNYYGLSETYSLHILTNLVIQ